MWVRLLHRENEPATAIASDQWYTVACNEDSKVDNPLLTPIDVDGAADVDAIQLTDVDVQLLTWALLLTMERLWIVRLRWIP